MLATIHWVVTQEDNQASNDVNQAIKLVYSWNERKRQLFKENHLKKFITLFITVNLSKLLKIFYRILT